MINFSVFYRNVKSSTDYIKAQEKEQNFKKLWESAKKMGVNEKKKYCI